MLMNNPWVKGSLKGKILNHTKLKENKNTTYQNVRDTAKALLYGTFFVYYMLLLEKETSFSKLHFKKLGAKKQTQNWKMK